MFKPYKKILALHKEECDGILERRKAIVRLWNWAKENAPFEPDWSNFNQSKSYSIYLYDVKLFSGSKTWSLKPQTELPYFATSDDVERFNTECREDLLTVFNVK